MSRATRDSAAVRALLARVDSRSTGKLTVGAGAVEVAVYLLRGDVVAATAADDDRHCVRMLLSTGVLTSSQADEYDVMIESGEDVFSALLVFGRAFDEVLVGRFRQNLCDYLSSVSAPRFFEQKGVFVANIQMGHDTRRLLDEMCAQCDVARLVDVDNLVVRGRADPGPDPLYRLVADHVGAEPRTISSLLHALPLEPTRARVLVGHLLANHALEAAGAEEEEALPNDDVLETAPGAELEHSEELTVALPPPQRTPVPPQREPAPAPDEVPHLVAAPPPVRPIHLVEALTPISEKEPSGGEPSGRALPTFDDDDTLSSEVTRALDDAPPAPPIHRLRRAPSEDEEDEDDARTEQVDRRTWSSMLWSNTSSGNPPGSPPSGTSFSAAGPTPSRGSPLPPPSRMSSPLPSRSSADRANELARVNERANELGRTKPPPPKPPPPPRDPQSPRGLTERPVNPPPSAGSGGPPPGQAPPRPSPVPPQSRSSTVPPAPITSGRSPELTRPIPQPPAPPAAAGPPRSLADWLNRTDAVGEDELDFFEDHDQVSRGGEADGQFRTDRAKLERVEVVGIDPETVENVEVLEELEALEAPPVKYGAPVLSQVDAAAKIEVANEVLALVSQAFDEAEGPGRGRAVMQLLVDGVPSQFAALLHDLKVGEGGELPDDQMLRNLNSRPATEHRQLLNNSLVDIIERALSSAADELPEEAFDDVFGSVAGYRQRLGL